MDLDNALLLEGRGVKSNAKRRLKSIKSLNLAFTVQSVFVSFRFNVI